MGFYPPPQKGGFARAIFITLATTIFGLSLAANLYLLAWTGITSGEIGTRTTTLVSGDPAQKIAVVCVEGFIGVELAQRLDKLLKEIETDSGIKALVVEIDSPGGEVTASDEIYHRLSRFKEEKGIPVVAAMASLGTSGAYYVACASDEIVVQPTTLTGNIGVVMQRFDLSGTLEKLGAKETSITPKGAEYKNMESMFKPDTPEVAAYLRGIADDMFLRFKTIVGTARQSKLTQPLDQVANGKVYTADEALKLGLADHRGYSGDAYDRAAALAGLTNKTVVRFEHQPSLLEAFSASSTMSPKGGISISVDPRALHEFGTPRAMYLWRGD